MSDLLKLWTIAVLILQTMAIAQQCPALQPPEGVVMNCTDQKTNATVDCTSANITRGVVAEYRCQNGSSTDWANSTMKCLCRGRWKGLEMFNNFTNASCGTQPMTLPASNITSDPDLEENDSSTQPSNITDSDTNGTSMPNETSTDPTVTKSRALDLTQGNNNSNSSNPENGTSSQSDPGSNSSSLTTPLFPDGNNSSSFSPSSDNSTTTPSTLTSNGSLPPASNSSSDPNSTSTPESSNSSDPSSSSTTASSLSSSALTTISSDNSSSTTVSSDSGSSSSTTPSTTDNSSSSSSSLDNPTTTPSSVSSSSDNSSSTAASPSNSSSSIEPLTSTSVGPLTGGNTSLPPSNSTGDGDDTESRESKDLKLSLPAGNGNETATNSSSLETGTSSSITTTPSSNPSSSSSSDSGSTPPIATVGGSLSIMNSSTLSNVTSSDPSTTTPSSSSSEGGSSSSSSLGLSDTSTTVAPENLESSTNTNGSSSGNEGKTSSDFQTLALTLHNKIRSNHGSQPLAINETLNQIAQSWAEKLMNESKLVATPGKRPYAENLFKISGGDKISETVAIESAIKAWSSSSSWYNYTAPKPSGFSQIVWNATTQLGIGLATGNDSAIVVATYFPRGNIVSVGSKADPTFYFKKNVFPEISNPVEIFPSTASNNSSTSSTPANENNSTSTNT